VWKGATGARISSERHIKSCKTMIRGVGRDDTLVAEVYRSRVVIIEGESLAHARLLATVNEFGRGSQFIDGYAIDSHLMELIPEDYIGRTLSRADADDLLQQLRLSNRPAAAPTSDSEASQSPSRAVAA
jgi:hypothetical protein